nr:hypothetical protein [Tanacetum cinerariifolium]
MMIVFSDCRQRVRFLPDNWSVHIGEEGHVCNDVLDWVKLLSSGWLSASVARLSNLHERGHWLSQTCRCVYAMIAFYLQWKVLCKRHARGVVGSAVRILARQRIKFAAMPSAKIQASNICHSWKQLAEALAVDKCGNLQYLQVRVRKQVRDNKSHGILDEFKPGKALQSGSSVKSRATLTYPANGGVTKQLPSHLILAIEMIISNDEEAGNLTAFKEFSFKKLRIATSG